MAITRPMRHLARQKLDQRFTELKSLPSSAFLPPHGGWIRAIREAIGMPRHVLAGRMGVGEKRIVQLEHGEAEGKLTLESMSRAAEALGCDLVVALVPRQTLEETVSQRRRQFAASWLQSRALHTMAMESQGVALDQLPSAVVREIEAKYPDDRLWDEP